MLWVHVGACLLSQCLMYSISINSTIRLVLFILTLTVSDIHSSAPQSHPDISNTL